MKLRTTWAGILFAVALSFQIVGVALLATLGWTLDLGVRLLDWIVPVGVLATLSCLIARIRCGKALFIIAVLLFMLYFAVLRQSVVLR